MMENQSTIKYSVLLVSFPFDDFSSTKVRPAVCLTSPSGKFEHIIIAFISSKIPDALSASDILIRKESDLWAHTGLHVDSVIRLHKLVTVPKSRIKRQLGYSNSVLQDVIKKKLAELFEI